MKTTRGGKSVKMQAPTASSDATKHKGWPKTPTVLSNILRRLAPALRAVGVNVEFNREAGTGKRTIALTTQPRGRVQGGI